MVCKYFLPFRGSYLFTLIVVFAVQKFFTLIQLHLFIFVLVATCTFGVLVMEWLNSWNSLTLPRPMSRSLHFCNHLCYSERNIETVFLIRKNLLYLPVNSKTVFKLFRVSYVRRTLLSLPTFHHASCKVVT